MTLFTYYTIQTKIVRYTQARNTTFVSIFLTSEIVLELNYNLVQESSQATNHCLDEDTWKVFSVVLYIQSLIA